MVSPVCVLRVQLRGGVRVSIWGPEGGEEEADERVGRRRREERRMVGMCMFVLY